MDATNSDEPDKTAITVYHQPPHRKAHSYSQQLGIINHSRRPRNHSLDELRILRNKKVNYSDSAVIKHGDDEVWGKMPEDGDESSNEPFPEVIASGGGTGVFKAPFRAAVHPSRPPCVHVRPHPLRETQTGKFIRTIVTTETQLWAGQDSGVRLWKYSDSCLPMNKKSPQRGDEDTAPYFESATTPAVMCMMIDQGSQLVWSGHKDGKIRSWKMDQQFSDDIGFKEGFSWQAHRGPVLAMTMSFYGDVWTGSEGGLIKVWPWESVEKSLSLSPEERRMAALLAERSAIDLKSQATVNGVCNISSSDLKFFLSDNVRAKIWAVNSSSFSLWNARSKELLKVFNIEGQIETRFDLQSSHDQVAEDETNVKVVTKNKKEKSQSFLQKSRNAIMGAADAVRRAAKGAGALVEDTKKTEAIVLAADGIIWTGCSNGLLIQWDGNGTRLQEFHHHQCSVQSFCSHGARIWVGYESGLIQVLELDGNIIAGWVAHNEPVIQIAIGAAGCLFTLATHGGVRGWNISSPAPMDSIIRQELTDKEHMYTRTQNINILVGTWNVGQGRASHNALKSWLGSAASDIGIVVVGLQEVEMGAGFLAMSAAKETVGLEGSSIGQWWQDHIGKALNEGTTFERLGSRQLAALLVAIWVRKDLRKDVGDLDVAAVACGLGRAIGNKGGVGVRLRVYDRIFCFVNCHLAAHLEAVNRRNADFDHIFRTMAFSRSSNAFTNTAAASANQMLRGGTNSPTPSQPPPEEERPDLAEADMVVFFGDFNYRLFGITYDEARDLVSQRSFDWLREKDQLRAEMKAGKAFQGMREALIRFPPTYKFEKGKPGLGGYDSGEKKRIPAWCDRVLYRDCRVAPTTEVNLDCPVIACILKYEARMDVTESDHKPVRCKLNVDIAHIDKSVRRREFGQILKLNETVRSSLDALRIVPETSVSIDRISLKNQETCSLKIMNQSAVEFVFYQILCEGQCNIKGEEVPAGYRARGSLGFPRWLAVTPAAGAIGPDQVADVSVHHEDSQEGAEGVPPSWWSDDTRDKEVVLLVMVNGPCSTEAKIHRVVVRHCLVRKD